jgi:HisJ family histidinol phosphate phosphatase
MRTRNAYRVFQTITPGWDHDLHLHSVWSQDNPQGPKLADYIPFAEKYKIHIGFTDHFEMLYYETKDLRQGEWRLNPNTIDKYLEEIDSVRESFPHVSAGLELDYYPHRESLLAEFLDKYGDQFDLLIGSVHELEDFFPVTQRKENGELMKAYGSFDAMKQKYFEYERKMLESQLFDAIAHPDVIYRFVTTEEKRLHPEYSDDPIIIDLGQICRRTKTLMEVNTSGLRFEWADTLPSPKIVNHLLADDVRFFVGSDSHSCERFVQSVEAVRKMNHLITKRF